MANEQEPTQSPETISPGVAYLNKLKTELPPSQAWDSQTAGEAVNEVEADLSAIYTFMAKNTRPQETQVEETASMPEPSPSSEVF